ncbi:hypothetical protein [Herbidospora daliensis]|uniref:hypothetical protein n=1 Tax=Herbidospora daliensis TaxID=295585 RepID=UPI0012FADC7D|nr:hypothetical protein [Herbidospora daliensis]
MRRTSPTPTATTGARSAGPSPAQLWNEPTRFNLELIDPGTWQYIAPAAPHGHLDGAPHQRRLRFAVVERFTHAHRAHVELNDATVRCAY